MNYNTDSIISYPSFEPSELRIRDILLSKDSIDDYQRLFFANLYFKSNYAINVKRIQYKTNNAFAFNNPLYLKKNAVFFNEIQSNINKKKNTSTNNNNNNQNIHASILDQNSNTKLSTTKRHRKLHDSISQIPNSKENNTLDCFEYQLPDVKVSMNYNSNSRSSSSTNNSMSNINNTDLFLINELKRLNSLRNSTAANTSDQKTISEKLKTLNELNINDDTFLIKGHVVDMVVKDNITNPSSGSNSANSNDSNIIFENVKDSNKDSVKDNSILTKNQQYKIIKDDHDSNLKTQLINPNNCVIWSCGTGYVFLTGIWRLYQDIMHGLISMERTNISDSAKTYDLNNREHTTYQLEYILNHAFYEPLTKDLVEKFDLPKELIKYIDSKEKPIRKRRNSGLMGQIPIDINNFLHKESKFYNNNNNTNINESSNNTINTGNISYNDLHWNNLSYDLKNYIIDTFRLSLLNNNKVKEEDLSTNLELNNIIQRIRGGYIKIQGTWLPIEVARLICVRFCYPIRYLLVPIFGENFPKECENWFKLMEWKITDIVEKTKKFNERKNSLDSNIANTDKTKINILKKRKNSTVHQKDSIDNNLYDGKKKKSKLNSIDLTVTPNIKKPSLIVQTGKDTIDVGKNYGDISPKTKIVSLSSNSSSNSPRSNNLNYNRETFTSPISSKGNKFNKFRLSLDKGEFNNTINDNGADILQTKNVTNNLHTTSNQPLPNNDNYEPNKFKLRQRSLPHFYLNELTNEIDNVTSKRSSLPSMNNFSVDRRSLTINERSFSNNETSNPRYDQDKILSYFNSRFEPINGLNSDGKTTQNFPTVKTVTKLATFFNTGSRRYSYNNVFNETGKQIGNNYYMNPSMRQSFDSNTMNVNEPAIDGNVNRNSSTSSYPSHTLYGSQQHHSAQESFSKSDHMPTTLPKPTNLPMTISMPMSNNFANQQGLLQQLPPNLPSNVSPFSSMAYPQVHHLVPIGNSSQIYPQLYPQVHDQHIMQLQQNPSTIKNPNIYNPYENNFSPQINNITNNQTDQNYNIIHNHDRNRKFIPRYLQEQQVNYSNLQTTPTASNNPDTSLTSSMPPTFPAVPQEQQINSTVPSTQNWNELLVTAQQQQRRNQEQNRDQNSIYM